MIPGAGVDLSRPIADLCQFRGLPPAGTNLVLVPGVNVLRLTAWMGSVSSYVDLDIDRFIDAVGLGPAIERRARLLLERAICSPVELAPPVPT